MLVRRRLLIGLSLIASCQVYDETLLERGDSAQTGGRSVTSSGGIPAKNGGTPGAGGVSGGGGTLASSGGVQPSPLGGRSSSSGGNLTSLTGGRSNTGGAPTNGQGGLPTTEAGAAGAGGSGLEGGAPSASGGEAGDASSGGTTGGTATGGSQATGGTPAAVESCSGCARMEVVLTELDSKAHFKIMLPVPTDLSSASVTFVVQRFAGTGGQLRGFIQSGDDFTFSESVPTNISDISDTDMQTIVWDMSNVTLEARSAVKYIGIQLSGRGGGTVFTNPTVVYLDSVRVTGSDLEVDYWPFDTEDSIYPIVEDVCAVCATTGQIRLDSDFTDAAALRWLGSERAQRAAISSERSRSSTVGPGCTVMSSSACA